MESKKIYLTLSKKIAYGTGDLGSNFFYMLVSSFTLIYLTNVIGMVPAIVGTLIMISKLLDGITDVFFGGLIDKTKSRMGKARPWMFFSGFPLAASMILIFAVPTSWGDTAQYIWFFIFYTCANALFYTANNIAYATMSALITKNDAERVSLGSFRYIFAVLASIIVSASTVALAEAFGGGATGWRIIAIIFAIVFLIFNSLASLVCKEVVEEEKDESEMTNNKDDKQSFWSLLKMVLTNKYYLILLAIYLLMYTNTNLATSIGVYYFKYIMGNASLLGVVSLSSLVMIVGLIFNPSLVKKYGMYRVNLLSYIVTSIISAIIMIFIYTESLTGIVVASFTRSIGMAFLMGSLNALVAEVAQNNLLKNGIHTEGMMFSCSSIGMKIGGGIGAGMAGWLLSAVGYIGTAEVQTVAVNNMIKFIYGGIPLILTVMITVFLSVMRVDSENRKLEQKQE